MDTPKQIDDGGPAFPIHHATWENGKQITSPHEGMSLRDWFAANASEQDIRYWGHIISSACRESARYAYADAMIKARRR